MFEYDPFGKPFHEVTATDLVRLHDVEEGWYVEFKQIVPTAKSIAKSIAAFANHYGGWLVYGIRKIQGRSLTASDYLGVPSADGPALLSRIRDAVRDSVNPPVYFEARQLDGPEAAVGLESGRSIILVRVPLGRNAPYVHSSGVIYRRVGDASDPKPENDRFVLDQLWTRSRRLHEDVAQWLSIRPEVSEGESGLPFCHLFVVPDPYTGDEMWHRLTFDQFCEAMRGTDTRGLSLHFDNFFTSSTGYVARMTTRNDPDLRVLTWEQAYSGSALVSLPLRTATFESTGVYETTLPFLSQLGPVAPDRIIDMNAFLLTVLSVVARYDTLRNRTGATSAAFAKVRLDGIWRRVPYLDCEAFLEFIQVNGLPRVQKDSCTAPHGLSVDSLIKLEPLEVEGKDDIQVIGEQVVKSIPLIRELLNAVGIPPTILVGKAEQLMVAILRGLDHLKAAGREPSV